MTRHNPQKIHKHMSYTVTELSEVLEVSEKTCFRWIEEGLPIIPDSKKPILILGSDAKEFLRKKNLKQKVKLNRYQFYCFKCRGPTRAKRGSIEVLGNIKRGICSVCSTKMRKTITPYQKDYHIPSPPVQMSIFD